MAKDPAFLFYPNDWLGGTLGMTLEQKGAYMELLMLQFNRGHMTYDMICHTLGLNHGQLWLVLSDKFVVDDNGLYYNVRLQDEKNKRQTFTESRRNNKNGTNQHTKKEGHMTSHMEDVNEDVNVIEVKEEIIKPKKEKVVFDFETNNINLLKEWGNFIEMRKSKRKALKQVDFDTLKTKLEEYSGGDENLKIQIIEYSRVGGYPNFYPLKNNQRQNTITQPEATAYGIPLSNWQEGYDKVKGISISSELKNRNNEANR